MKNLNSAISSFDDWSNPFGFYREICENTSLLEDELGLFKEIWLYASGFELWNYNELDTGLTMASSFIKENYALTDEVIEIIVRAISYHWR